MESKNFNTLPPPYSPRVTSETSREEIERLLSLAEQLEEKRNLSANREAVVQIINTFAWLITLAFTILFLAHNIKSPNAIPDYVKFGMWVLPTLALSWYVTLRTWRNRVSMQAFRDQIAMEDIVELLREFQPLIAQRDGWSALDKAAFRIRIKRFDIAPTRPRTQAKKFLYQYKAVVLQHLPSCVLPLMPRKLRRQ